MKDLMDFTGGFADFETLFSDTDFDEYVIRFYHNDNPTRPGNNDGHAFFKVVIGYTALGNDILLHMVDAEAADTWDEIYENAERYGVEFQLLSKMLGNHGFEIIPADQVEWDDDDDDDDDDDCWFCNGDDDDCPFCSDDLGLEMTDEEAAELSAKIEEFGEKMMGLSAAMLLGGIFTSMLENRY